MKQVCTYCGSSNRVARFKGGNPLCIKHYLQMYTYGRLFDKPQSRWSNSIIDDDNGCRIVTAKGEELLVDREMLPMLSQHSWCMTSYKNDHIYAVANINKKLVRMHRLILNCNSSDVVDHINGNTLDNRKCNLRICTAKDNSRNATVSKNNSSGVTGVSQLPNGKWRTRIMVDRKEISLGHYDDFNTAVEVRLRAEQKYFGEFSRNTRSSTTTSQAFT